MHITLIDDSIAFDGASPATIPLGAAEKSFALLAGALAKSGHDVHVFNRTLQPGVVDGAHWAGWAGARPPKTDVLIGFRKAELLGFVPEARKRMIWLSGAASYLGNSPHRAWLATKKPIVVFMSRSHSDGFENLDGLRLALIPPGIGAPFLVEAIPEPVNPPRAIATAHPLHGVDWLVELWREKIHPILPHAELHLYSAALEKAGRGEPIAAAFARVAAIVGAAAGANVMVKKPLADPAMAEAFRAARVHLHPGHASDVYCHTVGESQSCGLPAVVRPRGAARERIAHNATGFAHADDDAFAMATLRLLGDEATYRRMSDAARAMQRGRSWAEAASDFEMHWG